MAADRSGSPGGLQAWVTSGLGGVATASCLHWLPPDQAGYWISIASVLVPVISYFIVKTFASIDESDELIRYKARLSKDLKNQKKSMKDPNLTESARAQIQQKYGETMLKLSTANQDFTSEGLVVED